MNEFVTDVENAVQTADDLNATSAGASGRDYFKVLAMRAAAAKAFVHKNPYPAVLIAMGGFALLGCLFAGRGNGMRF